MNPRLAFAVLSACAILALVSQAGCSRGYVAPTPSPTPVQSISPAPDTLYVQDATSRTIRTYKNASAVNGAAVSLVTLPTSDQGNGDVVHCSCLQDVLWYPSVTNNTVEIWTTVTNDNGLNPNHTVSLANIEGAAVFDTNHNYLYVPQNNTNVLSVYGSALTLGQGGNTTPISQVTLVFAEPSPNPGLTPHPQELLYDAVHDRLYMADDASVVAEFDAFGAGAGVSHTATQNREITGLFQADGMGLNPTQDVLFIGEVARHQIDVIKNASTFNGGTTHVQTITGFSSAGPTGLAYDVPRDILFVYDGPLIEVIPNATAASGALSGIPNRRIIFDSAISLSGFGIYVDTTH